ncbi:hypothetical protein RQP46_007830 [Phenoliferia psychrophenolica]
MASFTGDMYFQEGRRLFVSYAAQTQKVWGYLFSRGKPTPQLGAFHSLDVEYYFAPEIGGPDYQGIDYLISFVCTMDPNNAHTESSYIHWPEYKLGNGPEARQMLHYIDPVVGAGTAAASPSGVLGLGLVLDTYRTDAMNYLIELFLKYPL